MFFEVNQTLWDSLKLNLVPERKTTPHLTSLLKKSGKFILICPALILSQGLALIEKIARYSLSRFKAAPTCSTDSFREILADSRRWKDIKDVKETLLCNPVGSRNQNFLWGVGSCTYQDSGFINCPNSQWKNWEKKILSKENQSNQSVNLYSLYKDNPTFIAEKLIQLGVNSYRTSIEWSQIEPIQGVYCQEALDVYINFFKVLKDHGIEPMVTLHHFSEPTWFHDIGSFEKEQNILCFLNFALFTFPSLTQIYKNEPLVKWICTINEPSIEAFSRYIRGAYSPGVKFNFQRAASFLKGAMKAHFTVYKALKQKNSAIQIGFSHQYLKFEPRNFIITPITQTLTTLINDVTLKLFKEKKFSLQIPFLCNLEEEFSEQEVKSDFIGVQFYTRPIISMTGSTTQNNEEDMTSMPFREDPAGLFEAITETYNAFNIPVIVTENGISTDSEDQRDRYLSRALYALKKAEEQLPNGALRGYFLWSFVDNLEWDLGMKPQAFGAFSAKKTNQGLEFEDEPKRGVGLYKKIIEVWRATFSSGLVDELPSYSSCI